MQGRFVLGSTTTVTLTLWYLSHLFLRRPKTFFFLLSTAKKLHFVLTWSSSQILHKVAAFTVTQSHSHKWKPQNWRAHLHLHSINNVSINLQSTHSRIHTMHKKFSLHRIVNIEEFQRHTLGATQQANLCSHTSHSFIGQTCLSSHS